MVPLEAVSRQVGYEVKAGNFGTQGTNLPQSIVVLGEANHANQADLDTTPKKVTLLQRVGQLYGYGSPLYSIASILFPVTGGGLIGSIPVTFIAQAEANAATARILDIEVNGTATDTGTHIVRVCGRTGINGASYEINITKGDTDYVIAQKIEDAINNALGCPFTADGPDESASGEENITCTTKWRGLTAQDANIEIDTNGNSLGITYAVSETQEATGTPSIGAALNFGNVWNTMVINGYGTVTSVMDALESYNGRLNATVPTGRCSSTIFKPFLAFTGSIADDPSSITDSRPNDQTIVIAPAPLSKGMPYEAAANMCALFARCAQDTPHLDISGQKYPDMPVPTDGNIGSMATYTNRDLIVKKGCSTVDLVDGEYEVQDAVTTYHPEGEIPPQFRYVRNLMVDWNIRFDYYVYELLFVRDHAIANDTDDVTAQKVVRPGGWKGVVSGRMEDWGRRALIADVPFAQASLSVGINGTNPDRLDTEFNYKRTGTARIASTIANAGFNYTA